MLKEYIEKAARFELTEAQERIYGVVDSVLHFGARPCDANEELENIYQEIDDDIEIIQCPPTEEEIEKMHPGFLEDEELVLNSTQRRHSLFILKH